MLFSKKKHALNFILLKLIATIFFLLYVVFIFSCSRLYTSEKFVLFFLVFVSKKGFLLSFCYSCIKVAEWQSQKKTQKINSYCNLVVAAALCLLLLFSVIFRGLFFFVSWSVRFGLARSETCSHIEFTTCSAESEIHTKNSHKKNCE